MKKEALKLADELEDCAKYGECDWVYPKIPAEMIRKLVAELDKKWYLIDTHGYVEPQPKPLSDDVLEAIVLNFVGEDDELDFVGFAKAIEERHGIK
jgi:hypothetical protein